MILSLLPFFLGITTFICASISWQGEAPGGFSVKVTLSKEKLSIDDFLTITVNFQYPTTHTLDIDKLRANLMTFPGLAEPPFLLTSEKQIDDVIVFELEPLTAGVHFLSFYDIVFLPKNAEDAKQNGAQEIISKIFTVSVDLPVIDKNFEGIVYPLLSLTERYPIGISEENRLALLQNQESQGKRVERIFQQKVIPWKHLLSLFLLFIVVLIAKMLPKTAGPLDLQKRKEVLTARGKALRALASLKKQPLLEKGDFKQFYQRLTSAVRSYIEEHYQVSVSAKTTPEFLESMATAQILDLDSRKTLQDFLIQADLIKFADKMPSQQECEKAQGLAEQLVLLDQKTH